VCVCERERERESVCECVSVCEFRVWGLGCGGWGRWKVWGVGFGVGGGFIPKDPSSVAPGRGLGREFRGWDLGQVEGLGCGVWGLRLGV